MATKGLNVHIMVMQENNAFSSRDHTLFVLHDLSPVIAEHHLMILKVTLQVECMQCVCNAM